MTAVAILGGTFDPVHIGHLRVAWEAAEAFDAQVRLVPASMPPHRPRPVADGRQRLAMLEAALTGQRRLIIDARELNRQGPSYTVDTLTQLRDELGPERPLILLLGADAFAGLPSWHRWRELFALAHVAVLTRPGPRTPLADALAAEVASRRSAGIAPLSRNPAGCIHELAVTALDVSASQIRALLAAGREPRWLLPDKLLAQPRLLDVYRQAPKA